MTVYVIDASVASRFLLVEDLSDEARSVLEDLLEGSVRLEAPRLVVYEVGNTLWKAVKRGYATSDEASQKFSYFLSLKIDSVEFSAVDHKEVLEWSLKNDATYYDSAYVRASKKTKASLLTADDLLYSKARKAVPTVHLKDYSK